MNVVGIPSNDGKMTVCMAGLSSCSSSCPCAVCIAGKTKNIRDFDFMPDKVAQFNADVPEEWIKNFPRRDDQLSNKVLHGKWESITGKNERKLKKKTGKDAVALKRSVYSNTESALLQFPSHKVLTEEPMHNSAGHYKHLADEMSVMTRTLDRKGAFYVKAHAVLVEVDQVLEGYNSGSEYDVLLHKGAAFLKPKLAAYLNSSKMPLGLNEFCFNKAHETCAGARYQAQHTGFELSRAHCMKSLAEHKSIAACLTNRTFDSAEEKLEVERIASIYTELASVLTSLTELMKTQRRLDGESKKNLVKMASAYFVLFRQLIPTANVYNKLHGVLHVAEFVERFEMCGRIDAESFESFHQLFEKMSDDLGSIPSIRERVGCFARRLSIRTVLNAQAVVKPVGKKRGRYAPKDRTTQFSDSIPIAPNNQTCPPHGLEWLSNDGCMKCEWADVANLAVFGKVPANWFQHVKLVKPNLGSLMLAKSEYTKQ